MKSQVHRHNVATTINYNSHQPLVHPHAGSWMIGSEFSALTYKVWWYCSAGWPLLVFWPPVSVAATRAACSLCPCQNTSQGFYYYRSLTNWPERWSKMGGNGSASRNVSFGLDADEKVTVIEGVKVNAVRQLILTLSRSRHSESKSELTSDETKRGVCSS